MDEFVHSCYGVQVHLVDAAGTDLCPRLRETFPRECAAPAAAGSVGVSYAVSAAALAGTGEHSRYAVSRDGVAVLAPATEEEVFQWLWHDIDSAVVERAGEMLFVHAGVVGW